MDQTIVGGGRLTLKRVNLDGTGRETILVVDAPLPGSNFRPSGIYPLSTISSDGKRLAISAFLGDGNEACQGHQCWRGRTTWAITSTGTRKPPEAQLIEGRPAPHAGHVGIKTPGGVRNDLSREFPNPHFYHFATDLEGKRLISDAAPLDKGGKIYIAQLGEPGRDPLRQFRYLLCPKSTGQKGAHIHPFLSPDGSLGFFNSDESGILQAYLIRGLDAV